MSRIRWRRGRVTATGRAWRDALELTVDIPGDGELRALAHPSLVGTPEVGDEVLLNTTAWAQQLGTGGYALVVAVPDRLPPDPAGPGHLVKARYTPLQVTVLGVDEQDTEHHRTIAEAEDLGGMPVVVADLHSALPAVLIGVLATDPDLKVAYVMTDGGALVAGFSRTLSALAPSLAGTVTVGQAFGGDVEAVTLPTYAQYADLARAVAASAHAIVVLTGDVHYRRVARCSLASGAELVEVIASPLALIDSLSATSWRSAPDVWPAVEIPGLTRVAVQTEALALTDNHFASVKPHPDADLLETFVVQLAIDSQQASLHGDRGVQCV